VEREKKEREEERKGEREIKTKKGENRGLWVCLAPSRAACHRWVFLAPV